MNPHNFKSYKSPELPIALRKQKNHVFSTLSLSLFHIKLSSGFRAFTSNFHRTRIPKNIHEVLDTQERKEVMEEIKALEKN